MYVWFNRLHALPMEELSNTMEWIIFKKIETCPLFWKQ